MRLIKIAFLYCRENANLLLCCTQSVRDSNFFPEKTDFMAIDVEKQTNTVQDPPPIMPPPPYVASQYVMQQNPTTGYLDTQHPVQQYIVVSNGTFISGISLLDTHTNPCKGILGERECKEYIIKWILLTTRIEEIYHMGLKERNLKNI